MIVRLSLVLICVLVFIGCKNSQDDQAQLLNEARSINLYPVNRYDLLDGLGLEGLPSQRDGGSIRNGRMSFTESWEHSSGLTVIAYDSENVGAAEILPGKISEILNRTPPVSGIDLRRTSFKGFIIKRGDSVIHCSDSKQK